MLGYFGSDFRVARRRYKTYVEKGVEAGRRPELTRSLFCYWAVRELGVSATSQARELGLTQPAVSISVKRGQTIADENGFQLLDQ